MGGEGPLGHVEGRLGGGVMICSDVLKCPMLKCCAVDGYLLCNRTTSWFAAQAHQCRVCTLPKQELRSVLGQGSVCGLGANLFLCYCTYWGKRHGAVARLM